jgi:hypothetical protein
MVTGRVSLVRGGVSMHWRLLSTTNTVVMAVDVTACRSDKASSAFQQNAIEKGSDGVTGSTDVPGVSAARPRQGKLQHIPRISPSVTVRNLNATQRIPSIAASRRSSVDDTTDFVWQQRRARCLTIP